MEMFGVFCVAVGNSGWQLVDSMVQAAQEAVQKCLVSRELVGADPNLRIGMLALYDQSQADELRQHAVRRRSVDLQLGRDRRLRRPGQSGAVCMDGQDRQDAKLKDSDIGMVEVTCGHKPYPLLGSVFHAVAPIP